MPKMSDTMEEGIISSWLKKVGDKVNSGDILAEVETDKATMELESYDDGILLHIGVKNGESVPVNNVIAIIGEKGENIKEILKKEEETKEETKEEETKEETKEEETITIPEIDDISKDKRLKASPLAKKIAEEKGINLTNVKGSGDGGRIIKKDIEENTEIISSQNSTDIILPKTIGEESFDEIPISQMRKTISKRLSESKFSSPHFYITMEINMENCIKGRKKINETSKVKISFNDIIIKATATALRIHIGVAVAVKDGLLVPIIKFADNKSLSHISLEVKNLANRAKNKNLQPSDWEGNTFTISNLGMFGIDEFTAIINPNDSCILAVGGIKNTPIIKNGEIVPGNLMKVTLSCDHRIVDGASGSAFLQTLKELIEDPIKILV